MYFEYVCSEYPWLMLPSMCFVIAGFVSVPFAYVGVLI